MKLLFDLQATQSAIRGAEGGGEYSRAVFRRLVARDDRQRVNGFMNPDFPLDPDIRTLVEEHGIETIPVRNPVELQVVLANGRYTSFMSGMPYTYFDLDFSGLEVFFAVHGLRALERRMPFHGRHYAGSAADWGKWAVKYALELVRPEWRYSQYQRLVNVPCRTLNVIVPSWHTKYSLVEKLVLSDKIRVHQMYCPETSVGQVESTASDILQRLGVQSGRYLFMVSGNRWIKNTWRGLKAAIAVMDKMPDDRWLPIVVTGGVPGGLPRGRRNYVIPTPYLSTDELADMYRGARAFFYPTLNEGFGYPPLEAMAHDVPVICAASSSVTEIVGDAGIYFNPDSVDEMKIRLRLALDDDELLDSLRRRGSVRLAEVRTRQNQDLDRLCDLLLASVRS